MFVPTYALLKSAMTGLGSNTPTTTASLLNSWIALIAQPFVPAATLTLGALTEATFGGYARVQQTSWSTPFLGSDVIEYVEGTLCTFRSNSTTTPNTIYGVAHIGSDSVTLIGTEKFANAVPVADSTTLIGWLPRVGLDPAGKYGSGILSN